MDCLKVPKSKGEETRKKLMKEDLLYQQGKIESDEGYLFIPVKESEDAVFEELGYEIVEREVEERKTKERDYKNLVDVPPELERFLPSSYDIIGDIAIVKLPEEIEGYKDQIGDAILETHKNLKTVLEDKGIHGEFRTRSIQHLAGDKKTETLYREHGVELEVDVEDVYFSPRLGTERWRVVKKVNEDEAVLDMFAGAGPYTVLIGRNVDVKHIYSIDLNPKAVQYLEKNIRRNNLEKVVTVYEGDAKDIAPDLSVDRVIMNLPHSSKNFIDAALSALDGEGTIHYYEIIGKDEKEKKLENLLGKIQEEGHFAEVLERRNVRTYSATKVHMGYDIFVERK